MYSRHVTYPICFREMSLSCDLNPVRYFASSAPSCSLDSVLIGGAEYHMMKGILWLRFKDLLKEL